MIKMVKIFLRSVYTSFATNILDRPGRLLSLLIFVLLLFFPITRPTQNLLFVMIGGFILAMFAASWDLLVGRCGQISLGHSLYFGLGTYTTALLCHYQGLPIYVTIPIGVLVGTLIAVPVGFPAIRLRGPYLSLTSMALPLIAAAMVIAFRDVTHGEEGIGPNFRFFPNLSWYKQWVGEYYLALMLLFISACIIYKIANSRIGIVFVSILDDELASKACGINVTKYKLLAFAISALFASLAGAYTAHSMITGTRAAIGSLSLTQSFLPVIFTTFGGIGTIYGPIAGALIIALVDGYILGIEVLNIEIAWHPLTYIIPVIILLIVWPRGIARFVTDKLDDLQEERLLEERGKWIWKRKKVK